MLSENGNDDDEGKKNKKIFVTNKRERKTIFEVRKNLGRKISTVIFHRQPSETLQLLQLRMEKEKNDVSTKISMFYRKSFFIFAYEINL